MVFYRGQLKRGRSDKDILLQRACHLKPCFDRMIIFNLIFCIGHSGESKTCVQHYCIDIIAKNVYVHFVCIELINSIFDHSIKHDLSNPMVSPAAVGNNPWQKERSFFRIDPGQFTISNYFYYFEMVNIKRLNPPHLLWFHPSHNFQKVIPHLCNESICCIIHPESSCGKSLFGENEPLNA